MKYFLEILLLILFLSFTSYSQQFKLTDINTMQYSIDRIGQEVYFKDFFTDTVRTVNLKNGELNKTDFIYLPPILSNKKHLLVYRNSLYDIDNQLSFEFDVSEADSFGYIINASFPGSFSPNDSIFMYGNPKYYVPIQDSLLKPINTGLSVYNTTVNFDATDAYPQWSSDTSFVSLSGNNKVIVEYFLKSGRVDTLVIADTPILGFAYNVKHNILAYSTTNDTSEIYFHYKNSDKDSLIFSPFRDDPEIGCWDHSGHYITSLSWSPDNKKLAFFGVQFIGFSAAGIYIYSLDSNRTYKATDCNDWGNKYFLKWANNDTLVYVNATDLSIYGIDVSSVITSVEQKNNDEVITDFNISNYPNPFNNSTKISVTLPNNTTATLFIYDAIGRLVKKYLLDNKGQIKYEITWDGLNNNNQSVSSGFYLGVLKPDLTNGSGNSKDKNIRTIKMIYLK